MNFINKLVKKHFNFLIISIIPFNGYLYLTDLSDYFSLNPLYSTNYISMLFLNYYIIFATLESILIGVLLCLMPIIPVIIVSLVLVNKLRLFVSKDEIITTRIKKILIYIYNYIKDADLFWIFIIWVIGCAFHWVSGERTLNIVNWIISHSYTPSGEFFHWVKFSLKSYIKTVTLTIFGSIALLGFTKISIFKPYKELIYMIAILFFTPLISISLSSTKLNQFIFIKALSGYKLTSNILYINKDSCSIIKTYVKDNINKDCELHAEIIFGKPNEFIAIIKNNNIYYSFYFSEGNFSMKNIPVDQDKLRMYSAFNSVKKQ